MPPLPPVPCSPVLTTTAPVARAWALRWAGAGGACRLRTVGAVHNCLNPALLINRKSTSVPPSPCHCFLQEYTLIKMRVLELKGKLAALEGEPCPPACLSACLGVPCAQACINQARVQPLRRMPCALAFLYVVARGRWSCCIVLGCCAG